MWYDVMIWHDMIWYDMIWYKIWNDMKWYNMVWYDMIWYGSRLWYNIIWYDIWYKWYDKIYDTIWYNVIWYKIWNDMKWYNMVWYDMIWYDNMIWYMVWDMIWYDMIWYSLSYISRFATHLVADVGGIRLTGGADEMEGRVEVEYKGEWYAMCDDSWGIEEANVVCKQLGKNWRV